jgi:nitrite reductase/ring-hydroxylating ferredoxin subunit
MPENWVPACKLSALTPGEMVMEEIDGHEIVFAEVGGDVYAFDGICSHALGYLDQGELEGHEVLCPLHEGRFDIRSGEVTGGEPTEPIAVYPIKVEDDTVFVDVPEE